ncbi:B3 domain-containing transcription factor VRN1-like isoform X2 [Punica granatum]|uniref:B3 domain-containing transcription factor VRN1-like isoform X2 n=2 Tax=Punica granatum TaxID=22663 RepID=A0A6P8BMS0_PUNGR|nr:B3 domain-containing transcription factor VRN1-like isoform X2 [Punica granatum]
MASRRRKRREEEWLYPHCYHEPEAPHFFKAVPLRFMRKYGDALSNSILLKVPSGESWPVELERCNGKAFLCNGWQSFAEHYSIEHGHFVVFRYVGKSIFQVVIFDKSASEVEYLLKYDDRAIRKSNPTGGSTVIRIVEAGGNDVSVEIIGDPKPQGKRSNYKQELQCSSGPSKVVKFDPPAKVNSDSSVSSRTRSKLSLGYTESQGKLLRRSKRLNLGCLSREPAGKASPVGKSSSEALKAAEEFRATHPFFRLQIYPSHLNRGHVTVPEKFLKRINAVEGMRPVKLRILEKSWSANLYYHDKRGERRGWFSDGWAKFTKEASLCEGDVCVFELIARKGLVFDVMVFKC